MDIVGDSVGHDLKDILHQIKTMGKKLDMLISTVSKMTSNTRGTDEVGYIHKTNTTTVF